MTTHQAKFIVKAELERRQLPYTKLTARTVRFTDLARASCIFVSIHGWQPNPAWTALETVAKQNGFRIDAPGNF